MAKLTLIFGNKNYSSWSLRPWVLMKHYNISFEEKRVALFTETTNDELAQYYSDFKVPVLKDDDLIVWDSLSILEYVSEKYLQGKGWPHDDKVRATARSVSAEMHSSFMNVRNEMPMNCRKKFKDIKFGSDGEWLFGKYSIADAMYAPIALRFHGYNIPLEGVEADYVQSVLNQPCIIEWIEAGKNEKEIIDQDEI